MSAPAELRDLQFFRYIAALVRLGNRPVYEAFAQVGRERCCHQYLENLIHEFVSRLTPGADPRRTSGGKK